MSESVQSSIRSVLDAYVRLTGREAKVGIYEFSLYDFVRAGFTAEDMIVVVTFLLRENKRNHFQYSLKLGHLINDHMRFNDLLQEAKAKERNRNPAPTPKEKVLSQFRPVVGENLTATGALSVGEIMKKISH